MITDHLGSTRVVFGANGLVSQRFDYKPFGEDLVTTAERGEKYTGKTQDGIGLYYYGARYYDPELGRFISQDPVRDGANWYFYCLGNPLRFTDPTGFWTQDKDGNWVAGDNDTWATLWKDACGEDADNNWVQQKLLEAGIVSPVMPDLPMAKVTPGETTVTLPSTWSSGRQDSGSGSFTLIAPRPPN